MANVIIVGTSHISEESIQTIRQIVSNYRPNFIAVELDIKRFQALISKQKPKLRITDIKHIGFKGFLFALIGQYIQKKLGKLVNTTPGSDMLEAIKLSKQNKIPLILIDQDIETTLKRFSKAISWKERLNFIIDIIKGTFFRSSEMKRYHLDKLDLRKVPSDKLVKLLTAQLKKRYPSVYKVLIEERNSHMIRQLKLLAKQNQNSTILVVVGAGHKDAIAKALT